MAAGQSAKYDFYLRLRIARAAIFLPVIGVRARLEFRAFRRAIDRAIGLIASPGHLPPSLE
jgi:hypothetical protein